MFFGSPTVLLAMISLASRTFAEEFSTSDNDVPSAFGKRGPMGFQGTRGKKERLASSDTRLEFDKRAPMGFQGTRGKKDWITAEDIEERRDSIALNEEPTGKRSPMRFRETGGGERYLPTPLDFGDSYFRDESSKRTALVGFRGAGGKKAVTPDDDDDDDYHEPPSVGLQATRGKIALDLLLGEIRDGGYGINGGSEAYRLSGYSDDREKRAPFMGFQGTRGKRGENRCKFKRAPAVGFQGTRGKKSPPTRTERVEKRATTIASFRGTRGGERRDRRNDCDEYIGLPPPPSPVRSIQFPEIFGVSDRDRLEERESMRRKVAEYFGAGGKRGGGDGGGYPHLFQRIQDIQ